MDEWQRWTEHVWVMMGLIDSICSVAFLHAHTARCKYKLIVSTYACRWDVVLASWNTANSYTADGCDWKWARVGVTHICYPPSTLSLIVPTRLCCLVDFVPHLISCEQHHPSTKEDEGSIISHPAAYGSSDRLGGRVNQKGSTSILSSRSKGFPVSRRRGFPTMLDWYSVVCRWCTRWVSFKRDIFA